MHAPGTNTGPEFNKSVLSRLKIHVFSARNHLDPQLNQQFMQVSADSTRPRTLLPLLKSQSFNYRSQCRTTAGRHGSGAQFPVSVSKEAAASHLTAPGQIMRSYIWYSARDSSRYGSNRTRWSDGKMDWLHALEQGAHRLDALERTARNHAQAMSVLEVQQSRTSQAREEVTRGFCQASDLASTSSEKLTQMNQMMDQVNGNSTR